MAELGATLVIHDLRAAVRDLYGVALGEFIARRKTLAAQVKKDGAGELAGEILTLRKPTVAAWALNRFVRDRPDDVAGLRTYAELVREAHRSLDAAQLRTLSRDRSRRVDELTRAVVEHAAAAGQPIGPGPAGEISETLVALIADEQAERAVASGALVTSLSYSGFGSVDLAAVAALGYSLDADSSDSDANDTDADADADDATPEAPIDLDARRAEREEQKRARTRERLLQRLDAAEAALAPAERKLEVAQRRHTEAAEGLADLERRIATARDRLESAQRAVDSAEHDVTQLAGARRTAASALAEHDGTTHPSERTD